MFVHSHLARIEALVVNEHLNSSHYNSIQISGVAAAIETHAADVLAKLKICHVLSKTE